MKISELYIPDDRESMSLELMLADYKHLGAGSFGDVYYKPGATYVLKVFTATDTAYQAYIALARAHPENPHFPKFFGKLVRLNSKFLAIRMEKLERYTYNSSLIAQYVRYRDEPIPDQTSYFAMTMADTMEFMEEYPELQQACDLIIDNLSGKFRLDINNDNLMLRGRKIVITDPVVSKEP